MCPFDGMAALIEATVGWPGPHRKLALVLSCYLDDSGESKEPVITMAGYLSLADSWKGFEPEARAYFDSYGIEYLHTVDFHHHRGQFEGWDPPKRAAFANGLFDVLRPHLGFGVEFSVLKRVYNDKKRASGLNQQISPYGFCFMGVLDQLSKHEGVQDVLTEPGADITFFVECGNKNNPDVHQVFNRRLYT